MMIFIALVPSVMQRILILLCLQLKEAVETNILEIDLSAKPYVRSRMALSLALTDYYPRQFGNLRSSG